MDGQPTRYQRQLEDTTMRKALWLTIVSALLSLLTLAPADAAPLQPNATAPVPRIIAITDGALCFDPASCKITASLTYNVPVAIAGSVIGDFAFVDLPTKTSCPVVAVTTSPPPAGTLASS